ncbi:MAG: DUF1735 domain-containing protein [Niabella sp.]
MLRKNVHHGFLLTLLLFLFACKKNDNVFDGLIYGPSDNTAYEPISSNLTLINDVWLIGDNSAFPVKLSKSFQKDVKVTAVIDPSLVRLYDSAKATSMAYPAIPNGALGLANEGVLTIKAGQTQSQDSARIVVKNESLLVKGVTYLVPIVITAADVDVPIDQSKNITFLKLTTGATLSSISTTQFTDTIVDSLIRTSLSSVPSGENTFYLRGFNQIDAPFDQRMEIDINNTLVDQYNVKNGTSYSVMPNNSYTIIKNTVIIPKGAAISTDSFSVKLTDLNLFEPLKQYLLPVELKDVTGSGFNCPIDTAKKVVYIIVTTLVSNVDPANPVVVGTATDRTSWIVKESAHYSNNEISRIKDGDYATSWFTSFSTVTPAWFTIDMGTEKTIKGFEFSSQFAFSGYVPLDISVQVSADGSNWNDIGKYYGNATAGTVANPVKKYISFYESVNSRYFKFVITRSSSSGYTGISEIYSYE